MFNEVPSAPLFTMIVFLSSLSSKEEVTRVIAYGSRVILKDFIPAI